MGRTKGSYSSMESWAMANAKIGDVFYSDKKDRHLTAIATHHNRKITTERLITVTTSKATPVANTIIKVTIL